MDKKLSDNEIVKALDNCVNGDYKTKCKGCPYDEKADYCKVMDRDTLDLIHRLQDENNQIKSNKFASWKLKFFNLKEEFDKELSEHEEFTKKTKAEIERLKIDIKNEKNWGKIQTKQAVKDTAKEIYDYIKSIEEHGLPTSCVGEWVKNRLKERYGVEVE